MTQKPQYDNLREACVQEAMAIIEKSGVEDLSLRAVSRNLGVSHQAPYKHFPSRDHILAEVVSRVFEDFAESLDKAPRTDDPHADLEAMGRAYLNYAVRHPLQYRLMFGTPLPDPEEHPAMMKYAQHAFALLRDCIARMALDTIDELDALFVWSTIHGLASILQAQAVDKLELTHREMDSAINHALSRIGMALRS